MVEEATAAGARTTDHDAHGARGAEQGDAGGAGDAMIAAGGPIPLVGASIGRTGGDGPGGSSASASDRAFGRTGGGARIPDGVRGQFESSLGLDLSDVAVHTDAAAAQTAASVGARAVTIGQNIFFAAGQYDPGSPAGQELLAHEVAHTAQQRDAAPRAQSKAEAAPPTHGAEVEADRAAAAMVAGQPAAVTPVGEVGAFAKEYTRDELLAAYRAALSRSDWLEVAHRLNGFSDGDIAMLVGKLSYGQLAHVREVSPDQRVIDAIDAADANAKRIAEAYQAYEAAVKAARAGGSWTDVANHLNGMGDWDIQDRMKKFTWFELMKIKDATDNARVLAHVDKADAARVAREKAAYDAAVKEQRWADVARHLNAFDDAGIVASVNAIVDLPNGKLYVQRIRAQAIQLMPDHHHRVTSVIDALPKDHGGTSLDPIPYTATVAVPDISDDTRPLPGTDLRDFGGNAKIRTFADELAASVGARTVATNPKADAAATEKTERARLESCFTSTGAVAITNMGYKAFARYAKDWMSEMREGGDMKFMLGGWRYLEPAPIDQGGLVDADPSVRFEGGRAFKVHPVVNTFLQSMGPGGFYPQTRVDHNGPKWAPYCLDIFPSIPRDERGLHQREEMVAFFERIHAAVGLSSADWSANYNDASVDAEVNRKLGKNYLTFASTDGTGNWHGALKLHVHLNLIPSSGAPGGAAPALDPNHE
jgi:hypothetical protein